MDVIAKLTINLESAIQVIAPVSQSAGNQRPFDL
jgi:hypothetical protein